MNSLIHVISSIPFLVFVVFSTAFSVFVYWLKADNFRYSMFAYRNALAFGSDYRGKLSQLVKQVDDDVEDEFGLVGAERTLCSDGASMIAGSKNANVTKQQFERARDYLNITGQNDIRPPGFLAKLGLFLLILAESAGTGYVLAPWMSTEITPSQANLAAGVLALAVAIVLALLTHVAGTMLAQYIRYKRKADGSQGDSRSISLSEDQRQDAYYVDKSRPTWVVKPNPNRMRFANRVQDSTSGAPFVTTIAAALIVSIMVGIFVIRVEGVNQASEKKVVSMEQNGVSGGGGNPFASADNTPLPADVTAAQQQTRQDVATTIGGAYKNEGVAASFILALIYLVTQFTAFIIAFLSAFSGQGKMAYEFTMGMASFDAFKAKYLDDKIKRVDSLFSDLRRRRHGKHRQGSLGSFSDYVRLVAQKEGNTRQAEIERAANDIAAAVGDDAKYDVELEVALKNYNFTVPEQEVLHQNIQRIAALSAATRQRARTPPAAVTPPPRADAAPEQDRAVAPSVDTARAAPQPISQARLEAMCGEILDQPDKQARMRKKGEVIGALRMVGIEDPEALLTPILTHVKAERDEEKKRKSAAQELDALLDDDEEPA